MPIDTRPFMQLFGGSSSVPQFVIFREQIEASIRTPPACKDACADCYASTFTREVQMQPLNSYHYRLSIDEAKETARALLTEVQEHKGHVSQVLVKHADDLMARWGRKGRFGSQQKRQDLLKTVAPDLPESSVFLISRGYNMCLERAVPMSRCPRYQHKLLLPWLTVDLLKNHPDALFALLHNRTVYEPEKWAAFDCLQIEKYFLNGDFDVDWSSKAMVMHGKHAYGTLVDWDVPGIHRADLIGFPLGLLILKAQAYLMRLLRKIVDAVMVGVPVSMSSRTDKWQRTITAEGFKPMGSIEPWSSYTHGFLCAAPNVDSMDILGLARSRRERAEDHLRALQCNIPYMRRQIQALFGAPIWKGVSAAEKGGMLGAEMQFAISDYVLWRCLETEVQHFCAIRLRYGDIVAQGKPLPRDYDQALGALGFLLINQILSRSEMLVRELSCAPAFSKYWARKKPATGGPMRMFPSIDNNTMDLFNTDRLYWILAQLTNHPDKINAFDFPMLFAMLHEHLAGSPRKESERLNELMHQHINDLAACHELMTIVAKLHRPQSTNSGVEEAAKTKRLAWRIIAGAEAANKADGLKHLHTILSRTGVDLMDAFKQHKPPQGPRGEPWLEYNGQLYSAMGKFWGSMKVLELTHATVTPDEKAEFNGVLSFWTTTEHTGAVHAEETAILKEVERRQRELATPVPVFMDSQETPYNVDSASTRNKKKTRPEREARDMGVNPATDTSGVEDMHRLALADDDAPIILDPIPVSRRNFDEVFGAMFPTDKVEAKRSVDWNTFLRAMKAVGCALHNGSGGSEVLFKHEKFGKIVFHKPHPESKIDPIKLHAWGHRLARRFQWSRARFAVATDVAEGGESLGEVVV